MTLPVDRHQGLLPLRRVGHDRELHQVPQRRGPRERGPREPAKVWSGKGEGKAEVGGVAEGVKSTDGGVTYVEWSYAKDNDLGIAQVDNGGGAVELTGDTVGKAVEAAKPDGEGNDLRLKLDYTTKEPGAYPILLVTYEIVCSKNKDATKAANIKTFLSHFAASDTQAEPRGDRLRAAPGRGPVQGGDRHPGAVLNRTHRR